MKPCIILTGILYASLTSIMPAETPMGRYITKKSVLLSSRTMNNVVAILEADGIKFVVPPGSIPPASIGRAHLVNVYKEEGTLIVKSGNPGDKIARISIEAEKFDGPVEVHIPITNPEKVPVAYAVDISDAWEPLTLKMVSPDRTTAIYVTHKPVTVAWVTPE